MWAEEKDGGEGSCDGPVMAYVKLSRANNNNNNNNNNKNLKTNQAQTEKLASFQILDKNTRSKYFLGSLTYCSFHCLSLKCLFRVLFVL